MTTLANVSSTTPQASMNLLADAKFRAQLELDPVAAFASVGIEVEAPEKIVLPDLEIDDDRIAWRGLLG